MKDKKKYGKYVIVIEFFYINLFILSVTSGSITIAPLITALGSLAGVITLFINVNFTLSNGFVKLLLYKLESKK